jgi:hypothetical protein
MRYAGKEPNRGNGTRLMNIRRAINRIITWRDLPAGKGQELPFMDSETGRYTLARWQGRAGGGD